jgi:8-oxo-dGTP pyrophosphatase MutT (NUDIX family)
MCDYKKKNNGNIICQNCGEKGHHIKECTEPTISLGIILYQHKQNTIEYLMVCRRNTIGFVEFIRGRYASNDNLYIQKLFDVMTTNEIDIIKNKSFDYLWEYLWMDKVFNKNSDKIKRDFSKANGKYKKILNGYFINNINVNINYFIDNKTENFSEQEWGFPKGRRNYNETNYAAAIREFTEETNIKCKDITVTSNSDEFYEAYKSYDNIKYKNIYYIAKYNGDGILSIDKYKREQFTEISDIQFYDIDTIYEKLRPYDIEKKRLITNIHNYLKNL